MMRPVAADGRIQSGGVFTPILRPRVVERIVSAASARIVLIIAPAGYGKSVALRQYLDAISDPQVRFDVQAEHAGLLGFIRGFADAVIGIAPDARKTVSGAYEKSRTSATPGTDLAMWMHAHIKSFSGVIAIDDLHVAEDDPEISKFLVSLIERTRGRARWTIASRSTLDLPVGSWLAYGEMDLNIDEQDLRFTMDEARKTAQASNVRVRDEELSSILEMTEGWPTALSFALRTSLRSVDLRNIAATTREMTYRYLAEQVYESLEDDERDLLHFAAYLPEIDLDVLRHAGCAAGKAIIESLRERAAFIYPDRPGVYRCHDLFREFLQHRVSLLGDAAVVETQLQVARALEASDRSHAALVLYAKARETTAMLRLLESHGFQFTEEGHGDAVHAALDALPQDIRATNPVALGLRALREADGGRFDRAESLLRRALQQSPEPILGTKLAIRLAVILVNQGRDASSLLEPFRELPIPIGLQAELFGALSASYTRSGKEEEAERAIRHVEPFIGELEDQEQAKILHYIASSGIEIGLREDFVVNWESRAAAIASENGMHSLAARAFAALANMALLYEDDIVKHAWYAQQASNAAVKAGDRFALQTALLQLIDGEMKRGNADRLSNLVRQFASTTTTDAKRVSYVIPAKATLAAWQGSFDEAQRLMSTISDLGFFAFDRAYDCAMHALYAVADGRRDRGIELVAHAMEIIEIAHARNLHAKRWIEVARSLCAIVESFAGRVTSAIRILQRRASVEGPAVDAMRRLARAVCRNSKAPELSPEAREALAQLRAVGYGGLSQTIENAVKQLIQTIPAEDAVLTPAEIDVLKSLAAGRNPKDIAAETGRSVFTVQTHIQNAIKKLGCSGRTEALSVARSKGLLP